MEASASPDSLFLEDFGQKVDLTRRIREVLLNYPEGTTVLKELIQNADDAGATTVRLCLDRRTHAQEALLSSTLGQWQGPALIAYNNAVFTEEDFASISRIGGSAKHGQAWKTGRFGVGFNSVYHLTDLPSFVSGKHVVFFDPQGVYLPNVSAANPGKRIEFVSSSAISLYKDQFLPYCVFGCDMKKHFPGTLFRFPLRNVDQAASSRLSRQSYSEDDVCSMFHLLFKEGVSSLLFLKSVLSIEMYIWDSGESLLRKLYSCSVNSADADTVSHRQLLLRLSRSPLSNLEIDCFKLDFLSEDVSEGTVQKKIDSFYIVQSMASGSSRIASFAATASREYDIHLLPWASVAASLSDSNDDGSKVGHAFCFLPLPVRTGLSVQVNGYFEVSSNRRGIWYGEDMDRSGKVRSVWNRLLLEDVIVPSFKQLLLGVQGIVGPSKLYYSLWPCGDFEEPWSILVECVYKSIVQVPVLFTDADGGKWVSPAEAFLHDKEFSKSEELGDVLVQLGMPIVRLPPSLHGMLLSHMTNFQQKVVTPDSVRCFLRMCGSLGQLNAHQKLLLLEYCLEDLVDSDVGKHAYNLPLLPLANGDYGSISKNSRGPLYFICSDFEYDLVQRISHKVVDPNTPKQILNRLSAIADSSGANIIVFDVVHLAQMFHEFVPSGWRHKSKVPWKPESDHNIYPTSSWFLLFWQFLQRHCEDLTLFDDWPILPSTSGHLHIASRKSKIIKAGVLSERMRFILEKIGCKLLDQRYGVEHRNLCHYVSDATGATVLESVFCVVSSSSDIWETSILTLEAEERNELRSFLLDPRWYIGGSMVDSDIKNCQKLPIFKVYDGSSAQGFQFSDLGEPCKYLPPTDVPNRFLGSEFVCSSSVEEEVLLKYYGVGRMRKANFYRKHVFNCIGDIQPEDRDSIMFSVLQDLPQLCIEDSMFKDTLRIIAFVPTSSGAAKCPLDLYDPRNEELYALLEDSDLFPCNRFCEPEILDVLQGLGLRTSVSPETILQSARQVEQLQQKDPQKAYIRGKVLLAYMEANAHRWITDSAHDDPIMLNRIISRAAVAFRRPRNFQSDLEKFWSDLRMICWCPVLVSAPHQALPWPVVSSTVAPPKLVRLRADMWLVSASMRILDGECYSSTLSRHLGWSASLGGSVVAAQILELGKNNEIVTDQAFRQELALAMPRIYVRLTELIVSDEMDIVKAILEGCRWIWVGDGFATANEVVLSGPLHLAPYIRVIPVDLAVFRDLFLDLGVREFLNFNDYANILCRMAARKEGSSLTSEELTGAIMIVQHLAEAKFNVKQVKIYLPDTSGQLLPASDLVYNDAPWLLGSDDSGKSDSGSLVSFSAKQTTQKFVHGNISNDVAEKLGVCSLRRLLLAESADSMNLGLSGAVEAFGQHEALTTRLKHILEMYADGPGVLFELVQNAEDAGASEVIFLLDKTQYGTSSILSPEMADWQGPALYCFNDSVFTPHDLYAISRIGQESKLETPFAIGRFGLGFNCVYHFTDVPSFVSGDNIVMFDPHASNLPGVSPSHPGLRIRFVGRKILEQFPDQFYPFLHFGCDLQQTFPGTLFRFPLRSASIAPRSQIKKEGYTPENVLSLFSSFSEVVSETLLFLHKVKSISIYVKDGSASDMQLLHRVERNCFAGPQSELHSLHHFFDSIHGSQPNLNKDQFLAKLKKSVNKELPWRCRKIVMKEQHSSNNMSHLWLLTECLGAEEVKDTSKAPSTKSRTWVPWAAVAAHLRSVEFDANDVPFDVSLPSAPGVLQVQGNPDQPLKVLEGRAFCFLPLPISTGLPAHVNAYFELSSNRRDIWFGNDMSGGGKKRSDWNLHLLENIAAPAYGRLLEQMALEIGPCDLFFSCWPNKLGVEPWSSMVRNFYMFISDSGIRALYTKARGGRWISTKQAIFPDYAFDKMLQLVEALTEVDLPVISISQSLVERFLEVRPSLHYLSPKLLRTLLIRRKCIFDERSALILTLEYCLCDLGKPLQPDYLYGLYLIPLANGSCAAFSPKGNSERLYVVHGEEYCLLKDSLPSQLVDRSIPIEVYDKICSVALSENSNLSFLTCHLLEKLFVRILPEDWQNAKQITWVPGSEHHPTLDWMQQLWNYLKSDCNDLSLFAKWPILPVKENYLLQLVRDANIIEDGGWSENISSLLLKVGCLFMRKDLQIEHPQLKYYVQSATASGIMNAFLAIAGKIENIERLFSKASEGELHELRSFVLQSKWFCECGVNDIHIEVIKHIPMFESCRSRRLVNLSGCMKWLAPNDLREDLLDDNFVRAESDKERAILKNYLNIHEISKVDFYKDFVLNHMADFLHSPEALSAVLCDVKRLIEEDVSVKSVLSRTPFVLTYGGSWEQPSRLYDPRVPELRLLLHKDFFFPSEKFSESEILDTLVGLGLKQILTYTDLLDCARTVSILNDSGDPETAVQGRRLVKCFDTLGSKLSSSGEDESENIRNAIASVDDQNVTDGEQPISSTSAYEDDWDCDAFLGFLVDDKPEEAFWSELKSIAWCPVFVDPPVESLPWINSTDLVAAPWNVRPKSEMWMVSSAMRILDAECFSIYIQGKLGWNDRPNANILATQLVELTKCSTQLTQKSAVDPVFSAELQRGICLLYSALQEYVNDDDFASLRSALQGVPWIWTGDAFVAPSALAFDSPVKFPPYLYVVPSELSGFRDLLLSLGVKLCFEASDYFQVLQKLKSDVSRSPLSKDQLCFVICVLEAIADCYQDRPSIEVSNSPLLIPDSHGVLVYAGEVVYNDAPWMENSISVGRGFVHPCISNDLASRLGVQSLRCMSLVEDEMAKDLPCMDYARIAELLTSYVSSEFLLFDLLELADCCGTKALHIVFDKRHHPQQTLLQHNLGEYQGPGLVAIFEGANLNREEISNLQLLPPWRLRGETINYGLGLLSCYFLSDLLSILSGGHYYMFDPRGLAFASPLSYSPAAKVFSLTGSNLMERFRDQFNPLLVGQEMGLALSNCTVIRMPLSLDCMQEGHQEGLNKIKQLCDHFIEHGSRALIFQKSVLQVSLSTWEEGNAHPSQDYIVGVNPSSASVRNPFPEKKWKKFQISRLLSSLSAATKIHVAEQQKEIHVIDVTWCKGETKVADQWLVVLSLGSGQTRNMALDRRYLAYNLTPVAGVAALLYRNGRPADTCFSGSIMSPLPLSGSIYMPVTFLGYFLVRHNRGRYLFKVQQGTETQSDAGNQLIEAWNKELMACIRDSYIELVSLIANTRKGLLVSADDQSSNKVVSVVLKACYDNIYSLWPRSHWQSPSGQSVESCSAFSPELPKADWECVSERVIKPFYARLAELPVWQLHSGSLVRVEEGMFLSQPGNGVGDNLFPATVCNFVKEHYPVFSVPWDLIAEIQAVGVRVREIKPKMIRELLRITSTSIVVRSVEEYIDVLEYCLSDIQLQETSGSSTADGSLDSASADFVPVSSSISGSSIRGLHGIHTHGPASSGGDALVMMTSFGKALIDFGRGVVEDIGRTGGPRNMAGSSYISRYGNQLLAIAADLRGIPCPTAAGHLAQLGRSELWVGNKEVQMLLTPLLGKFIHLKVMDRPTLTDIFSNSTLQSLLKIQRFSLQFLADNMKLLFHGSWVNHVMNSNMTPWISWENNSSLGGEGGPSADWIRLFWKNFNGSSDDLSLFADWPLIPAFLGRAVLCRVRERHLIFIPPVLPTDSETGTFNLNASENLLTGRSLDLSSFPENMKPYLSAFQYAQSRYPWLLSLLNQCNIPVYDPAFLDLAAQCNCLPRHGESLGQVIASKLVAAKHAGYFPELTSFLASDRDELFNLFASDFVSNSTNYGREELAVLSALPIYRTVVGSYTRIDGHDLCVVASNSFLKPQDEHCLSYAMDSHEGALLRALGVQELYDQQVLVRFGLPGFESKTPSEQDDILIYIYTNWQDLQAISSVVQALKETNFVRNADECSLELSKPCDLFDPSDSLVMSVFSGERKRFPGERFSRDGWVRILRKLGLRNSTDTDAILECAKRVEYLGFEYMKSSGDMDCFHADPSNAGNELSYEIWTLAEYVLEAVFSNFAVLFSNNFCNALGQIACVPTEKGFPHMGGKRGGKRVLSSYSESILLKDWPLAWSCAPILLKPNVIPPEYSWGAFHLRSPPPFSTVLKHLKVVGGDGGEDTLAHWPVATNVMSVEDASCEVLKFLDRVWDSLATSDIEELKNVAFLPAANGTRLVKAVSLFVHLGVNLSPFAFELPSLYLPFVRILKDLGLHDLLSVSSAKELLLYLQKSCGYQRLNPNEFRAVKEILRYIYEGPDDTNKSERSWGSEAVVPDDGCRLVHARSCVYLDSNGSRFIKFIDSSTLRFVHPDIPVKICLALDIKKLSDVVVEELLEEEHLQTLEIIGSVSLSFIKHKLLSRSFQNAVSKIVSSIGSHILDLSSVTPERIQSLLEDASKRLQFVQCIYSRFLLLPRSSDITYTSKNSIIPEWVNGSKHRAPYYVNRTKTRILIAEPPSYISISDLLSIVVSDILGSPTPLPLGPLFVCPEGSECLVVDTLRFLSGKEASKRIGNSSQYIGKEVMAQDARHVQLHPLRPFYTDEIVAWKPQNGERLKYGRVADNVRPSAGQAIYRLKVETGTGVIENLLSSQVFSFKSTSMDKEASSSSTMPEDSHTALKTETHSSGPDGSARGKGTAQHTGNDALQYSKVSPGELVQAVQEMLSAAGVNMDAERQTLIQTNLTLQDQLKEFRAALLLEQDKSEAATKEADTAKTAWQCRICLAAEVNVSLIPCGHVLCRGCSSAVSRCPFCRIQVTKAMRIFRP